jgi:hypothetical protein
MSEALVIFLGSKAVACAFWKMVEQGAERV